ncbi:hypothetical protein DUI87_21667 [Hirundo rustica rustica]|uniref:Retroviral nucleocapsid Gag protein p24 C-terminal domain-containing protein n=1 Tax=Hirundo rustica rustica TaxID=333673 RepID=A0A3M0JRD9_HIRRU|nr:hypothetical protein DUI87_21667 [Hirundo rustica rustica]
MGKTATGALTRGSKPQKVPKKLEEPLGEQVAEESEAGTKTKQLPSEPLVIFVERLTQAIELQVKNEGAQEQVLEEMALADADEQCKAAILSLSIEPIPTLHDTLQTDFYVKDIHKDKLIITFQGLYQSKCFNQVYESIQSPICRTENVNRIFLLPASNFKRYSSVLGLSLCLPPTNSQMRIWAVQEREKERKLEQS